MEKENEIITASEATLKENNFTKIKKSLRKFGKKANRFLDQKVGNYSMRLIVGCGLIVVGVVIILVSAFGGEEIADYPLLFTNEDEELMIIGKGDKEAKKIANLDGEDINIGYSNTSERYVLYKKDGNLYLYDVKKADDSVKIASDVGDYFGFNTSDDYVYFIDEDNDLYTYDMKEKEKIDSEVIRVSYTTDDKIIYGKEDSLYIRSLDPDENDKEKIAGEGSYAYVSENQKKLLIIEEDSLYLYSIKKNDKEKITSSLRTVVSYDENFEKVYYTETIEDESDISSVLEDDYKDEDESFEEITYEEYLNSDGEISYSEYSDNQDIKDAIETRDEIREYVKEYSASGSVVKVFDGKESEELFRGVSSVEYVDVEEERILYFKSEFSSKKLDIGDYEYLSEFTADLEDLKESSLYVYNKGNEIEVSSEDVSAAVLDGKDIYFLVKEDEEDEDYTLYYTKVKRKSVGDIETVDEGVSDIFTESLLDEDGVMYVTDESDDGDSADLKIVNNGKEELISSDVMGSEFQINVDRSKMYFLVDYSEKSMTGDLVMYNGRKATTIASDISYFIHINDDYMYLLKDFDDDKETFDLYSFNGKKEELVEEDITNFGYEIMTIKRGMLY